MANLFQAVTILGFLLLLPAMLIVSGTSPMIATGVAAGQKSWCIARPSTALSVDTLVENIIISCLDMDCNIIRPDGDCYRPSTLMTHASVVMNLYYQKHGRHSWNCDFNNSAMIVTTDPSYGNCIFKCTLGEGGVVE